jgi:DNA-3-methyladenine glycosylase II
MPQSRSHAPAPPESALITRARYELPAIAPYRLDLTVSALRRLSTNLVDVLTPEGQYGRALAGAHGPVIARVTQERPDALAVTIEGAAGEHTRALALVRRLLGVDRELIHFDRGAAHIEWLRPLADRMRGVRPPRYPTLWEAFVNAIAFQQVSVHAASAIVRRLIVGLSQRLRSDDMSLYMFPSAEQVLGAEDGLLRETGLSTAKVATLRRVGEALASGALDEATLEARPSPDAAAVLRTIKGIGPWTATVILLRGLGRLDVFPMHDSGIARSLALVAGDMPVDVETLLTTLTPQQGMLYYHLLLARLEARGEVGRASVSE